MLKRGLPMLIYVRSMGKRLPEQPNRTEANLQMLLKFLKAVMLHISSSRSWRYGRRNRTSWTSRYEHPLYAAYSAHNQDHIQDPDCPG